MPSPALTATLIQVESDAGLVAEVRVARGLHERHAHGRIARSDSQRQTVVPET
jgi:hypothetical protein